MESGAPTEMLVLEMAHVNELETRLLMRNIFNHLRLPLFFSIEQNKHLTIKFGGQFIVVLNFLPYNEGEWRKP